MEWWSLDSHHIRSTSEFQPILCSSNGHSLIIKELALPRMAFGAICIRSDCKDYMNLLYYRMWETIIEGPAAGIVYASWTGGGSG